MACRRSRSAYGGHPTHPWRSALSTPGERRPLRLRRPPGASRRQWSCRRGRPHHHEERRPVQGVQARTATRTDALHRGRCCLGATCRSTTRRSPHRCARARSAPRRLDGLEDELGCGRGLRHEGDVRGRHLHNRRVRAFGHELLERRQDRFVLGAEQIPARQRLPRQSRRPPSASMLVSTPPAAGVRWLRGCRR
jgi:hypothetical protein